MTFSSLNTYILLVCNLFTSHIYQGMVTSFHNDRSSGYNYKLLDVLEDYYICGLCCKVMRNAVQTRCEHLFCEACIYVICSNVRGSSCPKCKQYIDQSRLIPHEPIRRRIQNLTVECPYPTCQKRCTITEMELHLDYCECKNLVICNGCRKSMTASELPQHIDTCMEPDHVCRFCGQHVVYANISYHESNVCPQMQIKCPHKCGLQFMRNALAVHEALHDNSCATMTRNCPYEKCSFTGRLHELQDHLRGSTLLHAGLYQEDVSNLKGKVELLKEDNLKITKDISKLAKQHLGLAQSSYGSKLKLSAYIRSIVPPVKGEDWSLFQESITIPTDGKLVWKIPDFHDTFRNSTEHLKIYSQPFYNIPLGFKLCCYLQMGVDHVMRLSFQLMPGKFDEILTNVSNLASVVMLHKKQSSSMRFETDVECDPDRSTEVVGFVELLSFQQTLHFIDMGNSLFIQIEVT